MSDAHTHKTVNLLERYPNSETICHNGILDLAVTMWNDYYVILVPAKTSVRTDQANRRNETNSNNVFREYDNDINL